MTPEQTRSPTLGSTPAAVWSVGCGLSACLMVLVAPIDILTKVEGCCVAVILSYLIYTDLTQWRLPNPVTFALIGLGILTAYSSGAMLMPHLIGGLAGYAVIAAVRAYYLWRRGIEGIGLGDAKLSAAIGIWFGWTALPTAFLIAGLAGLGIWVFLSVKARIPNSASRADSGSFIPFGPALCLTFMLLWLSTRASYGFLMSLLP